MALIDSGENQNEKPYASVNSFIRAVRMAIAEELAATNTYDKMADALSSMAVQNEAYKDVDDEAQLFTDAEIAEFTSLLDEIRKDEVDHTNKLLELITKIEASL